MPTSSFTGGNAGSGTNKNVNNVIYVQDKGNKDITGYANIYGDVQVYNQKKDAPLAYLYVKYDSDSFQDYEYIYIFRTNDGGLTREVIPLTLIGNTLDLFVGDPDIGIPNVSYSRYRSGLGVGNPYANTTPPTYNASLVFDPLYTYYICIFTANDTLNLDFQAYISASDSAEGFSYINLLPNTNDEGNDVTWKIVLDSSAWTRETLLAGTSISNKADSETPSVVFSIDSSDGSTSMSGDVVVAGDLTVNGTTTTINTTNLSVEDTIIELNRNGTLSKDMGFLFSKSVDPKPVFYWNSLYNNRFDLALVTGATATSTNLNSLSQTPTALNMGGLTATTGSFSSTLGVTGVTTLGDNVQINWASGTTRTFQIQKTGLAYPYFWVNNSGNVILGGVGATAQFLANIDANTVTSNLGTINISGHLTIDTDQQIKLKKPSSASTPAILFNSDRTGSGDQSSIICLEVERGLLTNSHIKWDETNTWWDFNFGLYLNTDSQIKIEKFTTPANTPAILLNSDYTGNPNVDGSDVKAIEVERGTSTNSYIKWDETYDLWHISPKISSDLIYSTDLQVGYSTFNYLGEYQNEDEIIVVKNPSLATTFSVNGGGDVFANGQVSLNKPNPSSTTAILLNSDETGAPSKSVQIEVERGTETNSYIKWDEVSTRWEIFSNLKVLDSSSNTSLLINDSSIFTQKPFSLQNSLFYGIQAINAADGDIQSNATFVLIDNGSNGSSNFQPSLPDFSESGLVIHIAIKGSDSIELYPADVNQYIQHDSIQYSVGSPLTLRGKSSIQLISILDGAVGKNWYVTAINGEHTFNSKVVLGESDLTLNALVPFLGSPVVLGDGYITATKGYHKIATTTTVVLVTPTTVNNLIQINGGVTGMILILQAQVNGTLSIEDKLSPGNIRLSSSPFALDNVQDTLTLIYNGEHWCEVSRSNNA